MGAVRVCGWESGRAARTEVTAVAARLSQQQPTVLREQKTLCAAGIVPLCMIHVCKIWSSSGRSYHRDSYATGETCEKRVAGKMEKSEP